MLSCGIGLVPLEYPKPRPSDSAPRRSPPPSNSVASRRPPPSSTLHLQGKMVYAAGHTPARYLGYFFPAASAAARSSSFFCGVPSINTGPPCVYVYDIYTFCFCLRISASLRRANDGSCIRANRDLRSKKDLRFLSFRQRRTALLGFLLGCCLFLGLEAILLSLVAACKVWYRQHRAIDGDTSISPSRVILGENVVQCQRGPPRCSLRSSRPRGDLPNL